MQTSLLFQAGPAGNHKLHTWRIFYILIALVVILDPFSGHQAFTAGPETEKSTPDRDIALPALVLHAFLSLTAQAQAPIPAGAVVINEIVPDPQQDWNNSAGGDGLPFTAVPGTGEITFADEWIELLNVSSAPIDLTGWSLVMIDFFPATEVLGSGSAVLRFSAGGSLTHFQPGEYLVIGDPQGSIGPNSLIELRDAHGNLIDDVEIGNDLEADGIDGAPGGGLNGNALTLFDEAIARIPDGIDTDDDRADFEKRPATLGAPNGQPIRRLVQLPVLNSFNQAGFCESFVDIQNLGTLPAKGIALFWNEFENCPPDCAGPLYIRCTGLLRPGASWHFSRDRIPFDTRNGIVFSAFAQSHPAFLQGRDLFADRLCETLFALREECDEYLEFRRIFDEGGVWRRSLELAYNFSAFPGQPLAVEVTRRCRSFSGTSAVSAYQAIGGSQLGRRDPVAGGFSYYVPLLYADWRGLNTVLYLQNAGTECTSVELWFRTANECLRTQICDVLAIAPGETHRLNINECVGPNWTGSVWIGTSQPTAIVADTAGRNVLMTYTATPAAIHTPSDRTPLSAMPTDPLFTPGSQVNYAPLAYREYRGWDTRIQVQNLSAVLNAKVKVYFLDESGNILHTAVDWICPRSSRYFTLATLGKLPGNWVGQVRVESQAWFAPGGAPVAAPEITSIAQLVYWSGPEQATALSGVAYNLLTEEDAFDWQIGAQTGGLASGAGLIGIPFLLQAASRGPEADLTTDLAIANLVPQPGFTDFAVFLYDQNGLFDFVCDKLNQKQVTYIDLANEWDFLYDGFRGSAVISATFWDHPVIHSATGTLVRNLLGLAAVKIERLDGPVTDATGDAASASVGRPLANLLNPGPQAGFVAADWPACPP